MANAGRGRPSASTPGTSAARAIGSGAPVAISAASPRAGDSDAGEGPRKRREPASGHGGLAVRALDRGQQLAVELVHVSVESRLELRGERPKLWIRIE